MFLSKIFNKSTINNEVNVEVFGSTDIGRRRAQNQDTFFFTDLNKVEAKKSERKFKVEERGVLMLVADGMGGAAAGEVASEMAAETLPVALKELPKEMKAVQQLESAVHLANQRIYEHAQERSELHGMGTTVTAAYIQNSTAHIAQVGDSRAYLLRGNEIKQLTKDQSLAQYLVDIGQISQEKMRLVPQNVILQALGTEKSIDVAVSNVQLCKDDVLLLCSDGLSNKVLDDEMLNIISNSSNLKDAVEELISLANERGGEDNITVLLARFSGDGLARTRETYQTADLELKYQAA